MNGGHGMTAEHPERPPPGQPPDWTDLAPYASTGGYNQYSPAGRMVQSTNFTKGLLRNRHWYNRAVGWLMLLALLSIPALGLWRLIALLA
jgi:hypothetical protein